MKVLRVINNNVVSCRDRNGQELIAMGKGIGFRLRPGDRVESGEAEKLFRRDTPEETRRMTDHFNQLQPELLELCSRIIERTCAALGHGLNESIYLTLTDHVQFTIERVRKNIVYPNPLRTEVQVFYPQEYAAGRYALEMILKELGIRLPEDEAASIALHIVNAELGISMNRTMHIVETMGPVLEILHSCPGLCRDSENLFYQELVVHLKFMVSQVFSDRQAEWSGAPWVRAEFPDAFSCAQSICQYLQKCSGVTIPASEVDYLTVCIRRARVHE